MENKRAQNSKMKQAHVFISGFVQGVGFRQFVKRKAQELHIAGWAKNLPDVRVEALFQGSKEKIQEVMLLCKKGSFLSQVDHVEIVWDSTIDSGQEIFEDFQISLEK